MSEKNSYSTRKMIGGSLLVGGTAIGAGMLGLPIATGAAGFWPSCIIYLICWLFSISTGLLLFEVALKLPKGANIISFAGHFLGKTGQFFAWMLYIFLFYCLTLAYVTAGGGVFASFLPEHWPGIIGTIIFTLIFAFVVYLGTKAVDQFNWILMFGLIVSYVVFVVFGVEKVNFSLLSHAKWYPAFLGLPVIFTSFSYQGLVPSLSTYLHQNPKMVRRAILIGTAIPFVSYILWDFMIKGIVPVEGPHGLIATKAAGETAVYPLRYFFQGSYIYVIGQVFAFFAVTTSFLGVTLGLVDFLGDGLKIRRTGISRLWLCLLVFVPPVIISGINPTIFFKALNYAGGIGCVLLLGLFPVMMVWSGRYIQKDLSMQKQLFGGKIILVCLLIFIAFELFWTYQAAL